MSTRDRRFVLAGLVAPAVGGLWAGVLLSIVMATGGEAYQWPPTFLQIMAITSAYAAAIALLFTWTIGLAWHVLACRKGWRSASAYASFGAAIGGVLALTLLVFANSTWNPAMLIAIAILWLSSTGAIIALAGWLIRRPDRDDPNPATRTP